MASKSGGTGCLLVVLVLGVLGFAYYKSLDGSSQTPPAPPGSQIGGGTGRYVALGDSYTSAPKTGAQAGEPAGCARSAVNYPHLVAAELRPKEFVDVSCGGATTASLTGEQRTRDGVNPPQLNAVNAETTLVTVGIGGNDVGFVGLAGQCLADSAQASPCKQRLTAGGKDQLAAKIDTAAKRVGESLRKIRAKAPKARVVLVGYPTILPDGDGCWPSLPVGAPDVAYLREGLAKFNTALSEQAKANQAGFVDTARPSKGHDLCAPTNERWVEGLVPASPATALHPNAKGQKATADAVLRVVR
ncbi:SGNH/GDSL hydrolase family protein [Amycolatopsis suaedae]|uniref:SGNH/GDSL hydrolase family protein n=1 Tax=Amycolatopsis suaedae TaxID=2510978 RepID=A0A4Q7J8Y6_9PSEU|nr:SGNH/GDSL hydrolase family protein [Amycolatopsis suaedae]RZQ64190.1 SGNH/GDSL hydrolase family protein [Amycolatopsis suaedae]